MLLRSLQRSAPPFRLSDGCTEEGRFNSMLRKQTGKVGIESKLVSFPVCPTLALFSLALYEFLCEEFTTNSVAVAATCPETGCRGIAKLSNEGELYCLKVERPFPVSPWRPYGPQSEAM